GATTIFAQSFRGLPLRAAVWARGPALRRSRADDSDRRSWPRGGLLAADALMTAATLLRVQGLHKHFPFTRGIMFRRILGLVKAVNDVSFTIDEGETLALVGESGCGKTTTSRLILNLEQPTEGEVALRGVPIHGLRGPALRDYRARVQAVFQDPW